VQLLQLGRGHTKGDTVAWLPQQKILFSGDLVEFDATPYAGDAYFKDWPHTLDAISALQPVALVPGRGAALTTPEQVAAGLAGTRAFISDVYESVQAGVKSGKDLNAVYKDTYAKLKTKYGQWVIFDHCMPFDVTRCYDEATRFPDPRIWTAERDREMWQTLEG
jgi:glyoxylase-like metal-dependent hydrolase (beta-lactamase superfamily II)